MRFECSQCKHSLGFLAKNAIHAEIPWQGSCAHDGGLLREMSKMWHEILAGSTLREEEHCPSLGVVRITS